MRKFINENFQKFRFFLIIFKVPTNTTTIPRLLSPLVYIIEKVKYLFATKKIIINIHTQLQRKKNKKKNYLKPNEQDAIF